MADVFMKSEDGEWVPMDAVIRNVSVSLIPVEADDGWPDRLVNTEAVVTGSVLFSLTPRQYRRLRYLSGTAPAWQYPRWM